MATKCCSSPPFYQFALPDYSACVCPMHRPGPRVFKVPASKEVAADGHKTLQQALKDLEGYWLKDKPFMTGQQVAIPDLLCCCELEQLK